MTTLRNISIFLAGAVLAVGCTTFEKPALYRQYNPNNIDLTELPTRWLWVQGSPEWTSGAKQDAYRQMEKKLAKSCPGGWKVVEAKGEPGYLTHGHRADYGLYRVVPNDPRRPVPFGGTYQPGYVLSHRVHCAT